MFKRTKVCVGVLMALGAAGAFAQTAERIEVTGSRIKTIDSISNSPVTSVGEAQIKSSQPVAVEELIKGLSAATPAVGPNVNNGSGGGATIDLRGLGPQRTLVLIDGRRLVPFDLNARVDTNSIPLALLQRIDLVTGGASAVYGADAVSGVVNFILKKNFEGVELATSYGSSNHNDAKRYRTDLTMGANSADGKGNVVLSLGSTTTDPLRVGARDIGTTTLSSATGLFAGSSTTLPIVVNITPIGGLPAGTNTLGTGNRQLNLSTGRFEAYVPATGGFNTNPDNYFQTPLSRRQATALARYQINDNAEVYANLYYTKSDVALQLAASGTFGNLFQVPIGNPFIPEAARQQICAARGITAANCVVGNATEVPMSLSRRIVELGPRYNDYLNKTLQTVVGVKGDIVSGWTYDTYYSSGQADSTSIRRNWGSFSKVQQALRALNTTSCTNTANGCVPLNLFGPAGSISDAQINFINLSAIQLTKVRQTVASAAVTGDLPAAVQSPFAKSPISVAFGFEQRRVTAGNQSDGASQIQNEVLGTGAPTPDRSGNLKLNEFFAEAIVPLIKDMPAARAVNLELGYRGTEFTAGSKTNYSTSKVGGDWEPSKGLRFRGMIQRATRAPNVNELYQPQVTALSNLATDPCQLNKINPAEANTPGTLSNLCRLTGVPTAVIGSLGAPSSGQINNLQGGNPSLGPEKATTQTLGLVWEPDFVPGLSVSLDRYNIKVSDAISAPSTADVLDGCYNPAFNPGYVLNAACANVFRSPSNGSFNGDAKGVFTGSSNQGLIWASGLDVKATYRIKLKDLNVDPKWGTVDVGIDLNRVFTNDFQATPTAIRRDCVGYYSVSCSQPNGPSAVKTKFSQRTTWNFRDFSVGYAWRHLSGRKVEPDSGTWFPDYTSIPSYNYIDIAATWDVTKNVKLSLSITNLTDKKPPLVGNTISTTSENSGNTFPSFYDAIGRFITVGASVKF